MAPVRKGPEISPQVSGVGSATAPRWRGELENIERTAEAKKAAKRAQLLAAEKGEPIPDDVFPEDEEQEHESVAKSMPSWLVSTVIHLAVLLILALISSPGRAGLSRVLLDLGFSEKKKEVELVEFSIDATDEVGEDIESNEVPVEVDVMQVFDTVEPSLEVDVAPVEIGIGPQANEIAVPMFDGRSGAMKQALMAIYGGSQVTEDAVEMGLEWLAKNQQRNGSWSMRGPFQDGSASENRTAATAMALLAFCGYGDTHLKGKYQKQVSSGLKYLVQQQGRDGFMAKGAPDHQRMYAQAQATIAFCELYAMTKDSWLRPKAQLAIQFAEQAQSDVGGWRYQPRFDADTSVTGWYVMALKSAQAGGLEVNESKLRKVNEYLDTVSDYNDAAYGYMLGVEPSPAMTAEGLLCRQYLGWQRKHPPMEVGLRVLVKDHAFDLNEADVYYWYYATQALHHFGGSLWREWNDVMAVKLPKAQVKAGRERGSWAPQRDHWGQNHGRLYTTCLSIYCLEVYYRHLPLYKESAKGSLQ